MSDKPRDFTLWVNRLTEAVVDLMESQTTQGRMLLRVLNQIADGQIAIRAEVAALNATTKELAIEQTLLGNRVENALAKALRANIRLDDIEDAR